MSPKGHSLFFIVLITRCHGTSAWHKATCAIARTSTTSGGIVSDVQDKGREAVEAVGEVRDNVQIALDKSLKKRPYTTLILAVGVGFVLGALWAR
jgi:ElaB/YqjD/DUF883 family membrane-anchored ribosome-binding protein